MLACGHVGSLLKLVLAPLPRHFRNILTGVNVQEVALMLIQDTLRHPIIVGELLEDLANINLLPHLSNSLVVWPKDIALGFSSSNQPQCLVRHKSQEHNKVESADGVLQRLLLLLLHFECGFSANRRQTIVSIKVV